MVVYFLRGLPGSGKSTIAGELIGTYMDANLSCTHIEADRYFVGDDGVYRFDASKLQCAHAMCKEMFSAAIKRRDTAIVISNTSTQDWEVESYKKQAEDNGYMFFSLIVENRHGGVNTHAVPYSSIEKMRRRFDVHL